MALSAYRTLLRSARIAFQGMQPSIGCTMAYRVIGDTRTLVAAKQAAREGFEKERLLPAGSDKATKKIRYVEEVAKILRENVIQGKATKEDPSRFSKCILIYTVETDGGRVEYTSAYGIGR